MNRPILSRLDNPSPDAMSYTVRGATNASGLARSRLCLLIQQGNLEARKCGRRTLIDGPSLRSYLAGLPVIQPAARAA